MTELALSILDIAQNSQRAGAGEIRIEIDISADSDLLTITIRDNGKGMSSRQIDAATDPFFTTRTSARVGLGLPLFNQLCTQCDGNLKITSIKAGEEGEDEDSGTVVRAVLRLGSVNRPPLGDIGATITTLINGKSNARYILFYTAEKSFVFDTDEVKGIVGSDIQSPAVLAYLSDMINENIQNINGGLTI